MDQELRARAKNFYNALDFEQPINFGLSQLVSEAQSEHLYVESIHGDAGRADPMVDLGTQIEFSLSAGSYLFTGNRGTGKTTELLRLAKRLTANCEVFYVDLSEYLALTQPLGLADFLITTLGALSEKVSVRFGQDVGAPPNFFERAWNLLQSEVNFEGVAVPTGGPDLKAALRYTPLFTEQLQQRTRGHLQVLVREARDFVDRIVELVRKRRGDEEIKIVLIVDSVERLRGVGDRQQINAVFQSAAELFSAQAENLRFTGLSVVYTVPPYLQAIAGGLGKLYAGGRIYALPSVHVYECCPGPGELPQPSDSGLAKMVEVVAQRYPGYGEFFTDEQLRRLAESSGGDLRDYFRMLRLAVVAAMQAGVPAPEAVLLSVENAIRGDMLPIADNDRQWLKKIEHDHAAHLPDLQQLPDFARMQQSSYFLTYLNGELWYAVHPLLRKEIARD